jgi:deazaflavin-dependent oxidoreductase (nitroreductase family)
MRDFNEQVITEFRANAGRLSGMFDGIPILLLHHVGAKSGARRVAPLAYLLDGDRYLIFASKAGSDENPAWFHNLKAHPQTEIETGDRTVSVVAEQVTGEERDHLYARQVAAMPQFGEYQAKTERKIPVVSLTPTR